MPHSLFLTYEGSLANSAALCKWIRTYGHKFLAAGPSPVDLDLFRPASGEVPLFDDGPAPAAILEICSSREALLDLASEDEFNEAFCKDALEAVPGLVLSIGLFRRLATPVAGERSAAVRTAALSFVVRYYGPNSDERAFQTFYIANHPPILARFPAIRNVFCYLPEPLPASTIPRSDVILGNEVVFDDLASLNAALQSNVIADLKADSARFPPFGHSTHHAMTREKLMETA